MYPPCSHFLMKPKSIKWIGMIGSDLQWRVYIKIRFRGWGIKPMPPALKGRALTTGPQRKSLKFHFYCLTGAVGWSSFWVSHRVKNVSSQSCLTKLQPLSWKGLREFSRAFCLQRGRGDTSPTSLRGARAGPSVMAENIQKGSKADSGGSHCVISISQMTTQA